MLIVVLYVLSSFIGGDEIRDLSPVAEAMPTSHFSYFSSPSKRSKSSSAVQSCSNSGKSNLLMTL